jgi:hypothetical protein
MKEVDVISAIKGGVLRQIPALQDPNAEVVSKGLMLKAIIKVGRMPGVDWNREGVTFNFTSGKSSYQCGADILQEFSRIKNLQCIWLTGSIDSPVNVVTLQEFNTYARGSTSTGKPKIATIHSHNETLEVWPVPDATYAAWGYVQKRILKLEDVPEYYHDVVIDVAIASLDPRNAIEFAKSGLKDMRDDTLTPWEGSTIPLGRHIGVEYGVTGADSSNLRGD